MIFPPLSLAIDADEIPFAPPGFAPVVLFAWQTAFGAWISLGMMLDPMRDGGASTLGARIALGVVIAVGRHVI